MCLRLVGSPEQPADSTCVDSFRFWSIDDIIIPIQEGSRLADPAPGDVVRIGEITAPSGTVLVMDTGYLYLWAHDRPPVYPEGHGASAEVVAIANSAVELRIDGADAEAAGKLLNRQWHPRYLFDIPRESIPDFEELLGKVTKEHKLDARLTILPERIPHRKRVDLTVAQGKGAGQAQVHGIWVPAIGGLPTDRALEIFAERVTEGTEAGRWSRVWLQCAQESPIVRSERVGCAMVDWARLMFADVDALGSWEHERPIDGQADFVFWGLDAGNLAELSQAPKLDERTYGWVNMPIRDTVKHGERAEALRETHSLKVATDFRPHSHHYIVLSQIRGSATESGTVQVGNAQLCAFMTTWGDGIFDVYRDFGPTGQLVRVRIEMGTPDRIKLMHELATKGRASS